jgi:hypothetical protein
MSSDLVVELKQTDDEIAEAMSQDANLAGGLLKALVAVRLEILRVTRAAMRQRIMAEQSGSPLIIRIPATVPDPELAAKLAQEIEVQNHALDGARAEAARFVGGLVHALKISTVATHEQALSMLRQRYLIARYGLSIPDIAAAQPRNNASAQAATSAVSSSSPSMAVLTVRILNKQFKTQNRQDFIFFDAEFAAPGLKLPSRAIKGQLMLNDLFGEAKMTIGWTVERPINSGETFVEKGQGFKYNQFMEQHQWVNSTDIQNMSASFVVSSILYQDGSRDDFA